jgi:hypothetical protein
MHLNAPEQPSLDDRTRRRIGILLRQMYDDQLHEELPPKFATKLDRLPASGSAASQSSWPALFAVPDPATVLSGSGSRGKSEGFWNGVVFWPRLVSFWGGAPPRRRPIPLNSNSTSTDSTGRSKTSVIHPSAS